MTIEIDFIEDNDPDPIDLVPPASWSAAAVRLLQGVVYHDDKETWESITSSLSPLRDFFSRLSLALIVDESDGMAYLRQLDDDEVSADHEKIPRLFRRTRLNFEATLLCVLLRDELRRFEEEDVQNERCVVTESELLEAWQAFFPSESDQLRLAKQLRNNLKKIEALRFVKPFEKEPPSWEIRRILKARLTIEQLETLRSDLLEAVTAREQSSSASQPPPRDEVVVQEPAQTDIIFEAS